MAVFLRSLYDSSSCEKHCFYKISVSDNDMPSIDGLYEPPFPERKHKVVGYCKGLFCLEYDNGKNLVWNPSNNEFECLPPSDLKPPPCPYPNCADTVNNIDNNCTVHVASGIRGLGFDPHSGDYKAVRLAANFYVHSKDYRCLRQAEVYSLKNGCWKEICPEGEQYYVVDKFATCVNGFCYWIAERKGAVQTEIIVSLDLANEKFSSLSLPSCGYTRSEFGFALMEFEKSLAHVIYQMRRINKHLLQWVRVAKDGGRPQWISKTRFQFREAERPLGYCGEFLLFEGADCKLLVYEDSQKIFRKIDTIYDYPHCMQLFPYAESNVSFDTVETLLKRKGKSKKGGKKEEKKPKKRNEKKKEGGDAEKKVEKKPKKRNKKSKKEGDAEKEGEEKPKRKEKSKKEGNADRTGRKKAKGEEGKETKSLVSAG